MTAVPGPFARRDLAYPLLAAALFAGALLVGCDLAPVQETPEENQCTSTWEEFRDRSAACGVANPRKQVPSPCDSVTLAELQCEGCCMIGVTNSSPDYSFPACSDLTAPSPFVLQCLGDCVEDPRLTPCQATDDPALTSCQADYQALTRSFILCGVEPPLRPPTLALENCDADVAATMACQRCCLDQGSTGSVCAGLAVPAGETSSPTASCIAACDEDATTCQ